MTPNSPKANLLDTHARSVAKAISWRVTGTLDTIIIAGLITGRINTALSIGLVELFTKMCLYYLHERGWNRIAFGRPKLPRDYEI
jgi:uncharacterized membrane protein